MVIPHGRLEKRSGFQWLWLSRKPIMADEKDNNFTVNTFSPEFHADGIPLCLEWSSEDVAEWIEYLGFPQYKVKRT